MQKVSFLLPIVLAAALVAGCGGGGGASLNSEDVAVVGGVHISKVEYNALLRQAQQSFKQQGRPFPKQGTTEYAGIKSQAVTLLVNQAERQAKAESMGIEVTDKQVQDRLDQIIKQYFQNKQSRYKAQLKKQHLTEAQVRKDIRAQLISEAVISKVKKDVKVTKDDVHAYSLAHPELSSQPQSRDVRYILVKSKATADSIYNQVKTGGDKAWCRLTEKNAKEQKRPNWRKEVVPTHEEVREGPDLPELRQGDVFQGSDCPRLRQDRVLAAHEEGACAVLRPDAVQAVVRRRAARGREAARDDAREAGRTLDQAAAAAAEEERGDDRVGLRDLEGVLLRLEDQVPERVHAEPGPLHVDHFDERHDERHDDRLDRWPWRTLSSSSRS